MALTDNLLCGYKFEEATGTATWADVLSTFPLTAAGTITSASGLIGQAASGFSGANTLSLASVPVTATPFSISFWINITSSASINYFWEEQAGGVAKTSVLLVPGRTASLTFNIGGATVIYAVNPTLNAWHHIVCVADGSNASIYYDGVLRAQSANISSPSGGSSMYVGSNVAASNLAGKIDCLYLWSRALTDGGVTVGQTAGGEVATLYNGGIGLDYPFAVLFDAASNSSFQVASNNYTFNRTCNGINRCLTVKVAILGTPGTTVTSITDDDGGGNVAMSFIGRGSSATGAGIVEFWQLVAPATGTKSIRVQLSGSVTSAALAANYTNVNQTTPWANFNSNSATNGVGAADATVDITTSSAGSWVAAAVATTDPSITANQTIRNNVNGGISNSGADEDTNATVSPGTTTMSYTGIGGGQTWVIGGFELRMVGSVFVNEEYEDNRIVSITRW